MLIFKGNNSVSMKQKNQIYATLRNFSCSRSSERVSGPNCSVLNSFPVLWSCCWEAHCGSVAGRPRWAQHAPCTPSAGGRRGSGEGSEPRQAQPHLLCLFFWGQQTFLYQPDPADRCVCSTNPECRQITAAITVLFIWEAKSKIASDLGVRGDAKRGALCLDPQRV